MLTVFLKKFYLLIQLKFYLDYIENGFFIDFKSYPCTHSSMAIYVSCKGTFWVRVRVKFIVANLTMVDVTDWNASLVSIFNII